MVRLGESSRGGLGLSGCVGVSLGRAVELGHVGLRFGGLWRSGSGPVRPAASRNGVVR